LGRAGLTDRFRERHQALLGHDPTLKTRIRSLVTGHSSTM
jgi:hypothetical protein